MNSFLKEVFEETKMHYALVFTRALRQTNNLFGLIQIMLPLSLTLFHVGSKNVAVQTKEF